ncbi:aspartate--tRNA ligase [Candidatus Woesearchaeota archaeon CG10_big_fil_rev_8_21_14_0_10_37_12]|nr:MAG: aspartate--tRNA ligase [Candidatus Woesearchaeota archaeon CG10_big_fil_rev_8_21_14_0_10_37_12]
MKRTHTCGELTKTDIQQEVTLCGWVQTRRDHGGVVFVDLRDRYGITQVVFDPSHNKNVHSKADKLGREWVLQITGKVSLRPKGMENSKLKTGEIEIMTDHLEILNIAETPPIEIEDNLEAGEDTRLKYRYLDLRRPSMQKKLMFRHEIMHATREYFKQNQFVEIETPILVKTTPGGARVFKTPSRVHPGKFYALPESPQIYKQLLMVAGLDRYFQIPKCLRDEDLRADRQPEFTQIDVEMSFVEEKDIQDMIEGLFKYLFKTVLNKELPTPFSRLTFYDAMSKYGSDKPDLRFGLEFEDVTEIIKHSDFGVFKSAADKNGHVFCLNAKGAGGFSRTELEEIIDIGKRHGLGGVAWMKVNGTVLESNIVKYFSAEVQKQLIEKIKAQDGDLLLFAADEFEKAANGLGQVRLHIGKKLNLIKDEWKFLWVVDFPLYEQVEDKWTARHHIFTHPKDEDLDKLETDPGTVRGKMYDVVLNGWELGGGSIRIHRKDVQARVCQVLGMTYEEAEKTFDFLLNAFKYGAPPHGGIALGLDRTTALLSGIADIREVIAFPRNKAAENPMDGSPQEWNKEFLDDLHMKLDVVKKQ